MKFGCGRGSRFAAGDPHRQREAVELVQGAEMPMQLDQPRQRVERLADELLTRTANR